MATTKFSQATLDLIEDLITYAISNPKEAVKGSINFDVGGAIQYRSLDELMAQRNAIKKILDDESDIDFDEAKVSQYRPFTQTVTHCGNL